MNRKDTEVGMLGLHQHCSFAVLDLVVAEAVLLFSLVNFYFVATATHLVDSFFFFMRWGSAKC